ncbi:MAG: N-acetyltransferase, partial [Saprospiraceae bacterium]
MYTMEFLPIQPTAAENTAFIDHPDCQGSLYMSMDFYKRMGFEPPWIGYYARTGNQLVGMAGYKGRPQAGKVEIAYG